MRAAFDLKVKVKRCIVQWCNGSTTGFGSVCGGSNPPWTTKTFSKNKLLWQIYFH